MAGPQLFTLLEPLAAITGRSGQSLRREIEHQTFAFVRQLRQQERFDGTTISLATVEVRINRLAAPNMSADWRLKDQFGVVYHCESVVPSDNRQYWLARAVRTGGPVAVSVGDFDRDFDRDFA